MYKNYIIITLLCCIAYTPLTAQNLSSAPTGEAALFGGAQGGNPTLNLVLLELRTNKPNIYDGEILGSPYLTEKFVKSKVYYADELMGDYYMRYNALNSEIEVKQTDAEEEKAKRLLPDKNLRIEYQNKELSFMTYVNKKKITKNGYLTQMVDGKYKLFHRLAIKFSEGKAAANSQVNPIPSRFVPFTEYYFQKEGINRIDQIATQKGKFLKQFDNPLKEELKLFFKEAKIDLGKEEDLVEVFEYLNKR